MEVLFAVGTHQMKLRFADLHMFSEFIYGSYFICTFNLLALLELIRIAIIAHDLKHELWSLWRIVILTQDNNS